MSNIAVVRTGAPARVRASSSPRARLVPTAPLGSPTQRSFASSAPGVKRACSVDVSRAREAVFAKLVRFAGTASIAAIAVASLIVVLASFFGFSNAPIGG